jgi:hypothetical protein
VLAVDHRFEPQSGQAKDYTVILLYLSIKHLVEARAKIDWLEIRKKGPNGVTCLPANLFQWASTIKIQSSALNYYNTEIIIISLNLVLESCHDQAKKNAHLVLSNNQHLQYSFIFFFCKNFNQTSASFHLLREEMRFYFDLYSANFQKRSYKNPKVSKWKLLI